MYIRSFVLLGLLSCIATAENDNNFQHSNPWFYQVENAKNKGNVKYYIVPLESDSEFNIYPWEIFDTEHLTGHNQQLRIRRNSGWKGTWDVANGDNPFDPKTSVFTYGAGASYKKNGDSFNSGVSVTPGVWKTAHVDGSATIFDNSRHSVRASGSHDTVFTPNFQVAAQTTTGNLAYRHVNGAGAELSGTSQTGLPNRGYISATYPIHQNKNGGTNFGGRTDFASGMKPVHQFGLFANYNF